MLVRSSARSSARVGPLPHTWFSMNVYSSPAMRMALRSASVSTRSPFPALSQFLQLGHQLRGLVHAVHGDPVERHPCRHLFLAPLRQVGGEVPHVMGGEVDEAQVLVELAERRPRPLRV